ncbi:D-alanine--poly(phosphoribitol) ligase [Pseudohalioglobus sediminis]|uniref:D-alanine--poly(Phosphoribitol) ligase n=1 Tax=Pseudohalioglobus sediminis TaxID=2606449 RepID=A0A5B0X3V0_9GAMM|nr:amino acid adenylation domain-containing protein [Pseudohalioglobus sediminis]KAA1193385.1 D-alanine--poly(phosphoribitol) ligase [Pseudohalioglobus sediminis]
MTVKRLEMLVASQAQRTPDKAAIVCDDAVVTYAQLESQSNRLASALEEMGMVEGDRACLLLPKSVDAVICMLATLKVGGVYVPLDLDSPAARSQKIIDACEPTLIFASAESVKVLSELRSDQAAQPRVFAVSSEPAEPGAFTHAGSFKDLVNYASERSTRDMSVDGPAHILFTSGSTGVPKGVIITHRNVSSFLSWLVEYFGYSADDRMSGHPPLHFDLSTMDIFGTLSVGATLYPVPARMNLLAPALASWIEESELTQWFSVPSILNYMAKFDALRDKELPNLKRLIWCGEVLPTPTLRYWMQRLPHVEFTNLYGPTEATIASSYYTLPACPASDQDDVPIGTPCDGEQLLVLDERFRIAKEGEIGDLYISGVGLSPGYWRDEEKTNAAFLHNDALGVPGDRIYKTGDLGWFDAEGLFHYSGRADSQVKSRGYRIELGEIESALHSLKYLGELAVVGVEAEGFEGTTICCAYTSNELPPNSHALVRQDLMQIVPNYMLPSKWERLEVLPKNVNGKIDRPRLRQIFIDNANREDDRR